MTNTITTPSTQPSGNEKRAKTVAKRQEREKASVVEQLKKIPIVQVACEKVGISRATYYNWKNDDEEFAKQADKAISDGTGFVNDMAESQLLSAIKEGNLSAVQYWLKHRHSAYSNKLELNAHLKQQTSTVLNPKQEAAVEEALRLAALQLPSISELTSPQSNESDSYTSSSPSRGSPTTDMQEPTVFSGNLSQSLPDSPDSTVSPRNDGALAGGEHQPTSDGSIPRVGKIDIGESVLRPVGDYGQASEEACSSSESHAGTS